MEIEFSVFSGSLGESMTTPDEGQPPKANKLMDQMRAVLRVHLADKWDELIEAWRRE